ncbi:murein L,D-transpeptidase catalytic domain family protein [Chlorobium phaeovibrioides]|nr:murein L,D-transpeptidase catalytic domain family protein [Chlorobium phaeovibrioides]
MTIHSVPVPMIRLLFSAFLLIFLALPPKAGAATPQGSAANTTLITLLNTPGIKGAIPTKVLRKALEGYYALLEQGRVARKGILTVIDFNRPSVDRRIFVLDIEKGELLHSGLVAHGMGSGEGMAERFSNIPGSHQSSLGFYSTGATYQGSHGYSLRLQGLDPGINDNAAMRSIVIHGAEYVSDDFIRKHGRLGRSHGCPALSFSSFQQVIDLIKGGSCLFIYQDVLDAKQVS